MESIIKEKLISIFEKEFNIDPNPVGIHFLGKEVRPDFAFYVDNLFLIVEIKDDTAKNFDLNELLRQSINYRHSLYGKDKRCPDFCFATTTSWLTDYFEAADIIQGPVIGLAAKLGVGQIIYNSNRKKVKIKLGSKMFATYDPSQMEWEYDFLDPPSTMIGTKAKSNRI